MQARMLCVTMLCVSGLSACVTEPAPGAEKIRVTREAADVTACRAVGNVHVPRDADGKIDVFNADLQVRNQTVGAGGNTVLVTSSTLGAPADGIAYRCPAAQGS